MSARKASEYRRRQHTRLARRETRQPSTTPETVRASIESVLIQARATVQSWDEDGILVRLLPSALEAGLAAMHKLDPSTDEYARLRDRCAELTVIVTDLP